MAELRQHLSLQRTNIEKARHKRPAPIRPPDRNNVEHGAKISEGLRQIRHEYERTLTESPPVLEPVLVFRMGTEGKINEDDLRRSGLTFLDEEGESRIVVLSKDRLGELEHRIETYSQQLPEGRRPNYNWLSTFSGDMETRTPQDRMGRKLAAEGIDVTRDYRVDVELWSVADVTENGQRVQRLGAYVNAHSGQLLDSYVGSSLTIARVLIPGESLQTLLHEPIVRNIDLPPQPDISIVNVLRTPLTEVTQPISDPPDDAPGICVIDSGVMTGHPLLRNAMGYSRAFSRGLRDAVDEDGHGTMVAGVALYGDVKQCAEALTFEPVFYIYNARVLNQDNKFDDDQLIISQMRDAIQYFQREYSCRIFNISIGDPDLVYDDGKPSAWAHILDVLARELNIIIVVSAGNLPIVYLDGDEAEHLFHTYPHYFLNGKQRARILEPATAANVITVGSLVHSDQSLHAWHNPDDVDIQPMAPVNYPSPFTRCGPGVNNAVKPDVCEYGGNVLWWGRRRRIQPDSGLGIVSTAMDFTDKLFGTQIGTSMAAPKVAHLAARILARYPNISANLVRALIANAASIPTTAQNVFANDDECLKLYGYGKPNADRALYSADEWVTLVAEEKIPLNCIHLFEIPIPEEFQQQNGKRDISVSLAYDAPVRNTRLDYLGVKMRFRLFRGLETQQIVNWFGEHDSDADPDSIPDKFKCKMTPSPTRREPGTLQKATFTASRNSAFTNYRNSGDHFHLLVTCQAGWASPEVVESQRYALAVTIEHRDAPIQLYDLISQRIQARERVRVRR